MGNSSQQQHVLQKGEGYRVIDVKENSPFRNKVEQFFDFIIEATPVSHNNTADIVGRLSNQSNPKSNRSLLQIMNDNIDKPIAIKIVSTKYRKVRTIEVTLNKQQSENDDYLGINLRKQRFDEAFDTYFPVTDIQENSPIKKAGIKEGQYLIGCVEFSYVSIDGFIEGLYQRFFDKQNSNKTVQLAIYDMITDTLTVKLVELRRGWGGRGLLGCDFLQGVINKFPSNIEQRLNIINQNQQRKKVQLVNSDATSKAVVEQLENKRRRKDKHYKNIRNLLSIISPVLSNLSPSNSSNGKNSNGQHKGSKESLMQKGALNQEQASKRVQALQSRVAQLEQTLLSVNRYISELRDSRQLIQQ